MYFNGYKLDVVGIEYSKPKYHMINFCLDDKLIHRVYEPNSKRHIYIPITNDWVEFSDVTYKVVRREIKYLPERLVAKVIIEALLKGGEDQ